MYSLFIFFFFLYLILFCAVFENVARKGLCECVKTPKELGGPVKPDLSWSCGPVAVQFLIQSLSKSLFAKKQAFVTVCPEVQILQLF